MSKMLEKVARENLQDAAFVDYPLSNLSTVSTLSFVIWLK